MRLQSHGNRRITFMTFQMQTRFGVPTSVSRFGGIGLRVAPPPPHPTFQPEGAALVVETSALLEGAEQVVQGLREVGG